MLHMKISPSQNRGKVVQLVYKPQQSRKFIYNYLYTIASYSYLINYLKYFQEVYKLAVQIKMFHMTFSLPHNREKVLQLLYKQQQSRKFTYNYLYTIATHSYLINYLKYFQEVYELALWIKMLHMTYSPSHNRGIVVMLVYKPQQSRKFTYNYLYSFNIQPHTDHYLTI